jgi:hypothetical protein
MEIDRKIKYLTPPLLSIVPFPKCNLKSGVNRLLKKIGKEGEGGEK